MNTEITRPLTEDEIKEAVALWINCSCSKSDETITKDDVTLQYNSTDNVFGAYAKR